MDTRNATPGRRCCWCGKLGGAGFSSLVRSLERAGVVFRYKGTTHMQYLHPRCAVAARSTLTRTDT